MQATIAEMLSARMAQEEQRKAAIAARVEQGLAEHNTNILSPQEMREGIKIMRDKARGQENEKRQKDDSRRRLNETLQIARTNRDKIIQKMREVSYSRQGKLVPKRKELRGNLNNLRDALTRKNNFINALERKLGYTKQLRPRERRDMLIVNGDMGTQELFDLAKRCRPPRGYPAPPIRRSEAYPKGGTWGKPKGMKDIDIKQGEYDRLLKYCETVYMAERTCVVLTDGEVGYDVSLDGNYLGGLTKENDTWIACPSDPRGTTTMHKDFDEAINVIAVSPRVRRMMNQLQWLKQCIKNMGSEKNIRKRGNTREYQERIDARAN